MSKPVSLKGHQHVNLMVDPGPRPYIGGPVVDSGQDFVTVGGIAVVLPNVYRAL